LPAAGQHGLYSAKELQRELATVAAGRYAQQFAADAAKLLQRVPRALLLLLKTNDCLRSVDASLGQVRLRA
jgi:hypothetical protein